MTLTAATETALDAPWTGAWGLPPFAAATPEAIRAGFDRALAANLAEIAAIRDADAPSSRRIVTGPTTISAREATLTVCGSGAGASTTMAANSTASSGSGNTSLPCRARVLHDDRWLAFSP